MKNNIVRFPARPPPHKTTEELIERIRLLAAPDAARNSVRQAPQFQSRLVAAGLSKREVLETARKGCVVGTPEMDERGDWTMNLKRKVAGRRVQLVVTLRQDHLVLEKAQ